MLLFIVIVYIALLMSAARAETGVCHKSFCMCRPSDHPSWKNIACSLNDSQIFDVIPGMYPDYTRELEVFGGKLIKFSPNSLSAMKDLRRLQAGNTDFLIFNRHTAYEMNVLNLYLEIENATNVEIQTKAFEKLKGPVTVMISNCNEVKIQRKAFSWIIKFTIENINKLYLEPGAFIVDSSSTIIKDHGPSMTIEIRNSNVPVLPKQVFGSSSGQIRFDNTKVQIAKTDAFSATSYNKIIMNKTSVEVIEQEAFSQKSLIITLEFVNCEILEMQQKAILSAANNFIIRNSSFYDIEMGSINTTVAFVQIQYSTFYKIHARGFVLTSWNRIAMKNNTFLKMEPHAFISNPAEVHAFSFVNNIIDTSGNNTFELVGQAHARAPNDVDYRNNYYNKECSCTIKDWLKCELGITEKAFEQFALNSYCTIEEIAIARCFNAPDKNLQMSKFLTSVCNDNDNIKCEPFKIRKEDGSSPNFENPFFHDEDQNSTTLSNRNKKVIGIIIITVLSCVLIALFISLIKWMKRRGYCANVKNAIIASNNSCATACTSICVSNNGADSSGSISQLSVVEYTERHRLNEPRTQDVAQTFLIANVAPGNAVDVVMENKTTQTLPEELTKELLDNLRQKLDDPENYAEAREMIEHLYELIKVEENPNVDAALTALEENIYELPFQDTTIHISKTKKPMVSVGTKTPSIDKLLPPPSPYNRPTALNHEYFEPKDLAVHLYAEIVNNELKNKTGRIPDLVGEAPMPRGPYLRSVLDKNEARALPNSAANNLIHVPNVCASKTTLMKPAPKIVNRPLPQKPLFFDPGEGTSKVCN